MVPLAVFVLMPTSLPSGQPELPPEFIPVVPEEKALAPDLSLSSMQLEPQDRGLPPEFIPVAPGFIPAGGNPQLARQQYLDSLPENRIAQEFRAAGQRGETDFTPYFKAYRKRRAEGNLFGSEDRSGESTVEPSSGPEIALSALEKSGVIPGAGAASIAYRAYDAFSQSVLQLAENFTKAVLGRGVVSGTGAQGKEMLSHARVALGLAGKPAQLANILLPGRSAPLPPEAEVAKNVSENLSEILSGGVLGAARDGAQLRRAARNVANALFWKTGIGFTPDNAKYDEELLTDVEDLQTQEALAKGEIPGESKPMPVDPGAVERMSVALAPSNFIPFELGVAVSAAKAPLAAGKLTFAARETGKLARGLGHTLETASKVTSTAQKFIEGSPLLHGVTAALVTGATGAPATANILAGFLGANLKAPLGVTKRVLGTPAAKMHSAAEVLLGRSAPGPLSDFAIRAFKAAPKEAKGLLGMQLMNTPFLLGAQSEEEFEEGLVGSFAIYGAGRAAGHAFNTTFSVGRNYFFPGDRMPETRMLPKDYGTAPTWDVAHRESVLSLDNGSANFVEAIRKYLGKRGELYLLSPDAYAQAIDDLVTAGAISREQGEAAKQQQGLFQANVPNGQGGTRQIALSVLSKDLPGLAAAHEPGHIVEQILLTPEERADAYAVIKRTYGEDGLAAFKQWYESLANFKRPKGAPPVVLGEQSLLSEIFAEHVSAVLNSVPIGEFGFDFGKSKKDLIRRVYEYTGRALESIGVRKPATVTEPGSGKAHTGLGIEPSVKLSSVVEALLAAKQLDSRILGPEAGQTAEKTAPEGAKSTPAPAPETPSAPGGLQNVRPVEQKPVPAVAKGDPVGDLRDSNGMLVGEDAVVSKVLPDNRVEVTFVDPDTGQRMTGEMPVSELPVSTVRPTVTTVSKGPQRPATAADIVAPKAVENVARPQADEPSPPSGERLFFNEEHRAAWEALQRAQSAYEATAPHTPERAAARENLRAAEEALSASGHPIAPRKDSPLSEVVVRSDGENGVGGIADLTGAKWAGETNENGLRRVVTPDGKSYFVREGELHPEQKRALDANSTSGAGSSRAEGPAPVFRGVDRERNPDGTAAPGRVATTVATLDAAFALPKPERGAVEFPYLSAASEEATPTQTARERARRAADAAEKVGQANPLRQVFSKVTVPYRWLDAAKKKFLAWSGDKVVSNVDLLLDWVSRTPGAERLVDTAYLRSPQLRADLESYLLNLSNGYKGDGTRYTRPADERPGTGTPENPSFTPVQVDPARIPLLNLLQGLSTPPSRTPAYDYALRMAEQNGYEVHLVGGEKPDANPLRAALREQFGFGTERGEQILEPATEILQTNRVVGEMRPRTDIRLRAGDTAAVEAAFMPALRIGKEEYSNTGLPLGQGVFKGRTKLGHVSESMVETGFEAQALSGETVGTAPTAKEAAKLLEGFKASPKAEQPLAPKEQATAGQTAAQKQSPTGWVLPDGKYAGISATNNANFQNVGDFHSNWLAQNGKPWGLQNGDRFAALNKGFVRMRLDGQRGNLAVEANADLFRGKVRDRVEDVILENMNRVSGVTLNLFDKKGNVVRSDYLQTFRLEPGEQMSAVVDFLRNKRPRELSFMPATPGFFSQLEETLSKTPPKASRAQLEAALRDGVKEKGQFVARPVKAEEMRDVRDSAGTSFEQFLKDNPKATRQEMLDFVSENRVQVEERVLGVDSNLEVRKAKGPAETWQIWDRAQNRVVAGGFESEAEARSNLDHPSVLASGADVSNTKFETYVLPGGENYRETILTLPGGVSPEAYLDGAGPNGEMVWRVNGEPVSPVFPGTRAAHEWRNQQPKGYVSSHFFDVPNYLAHARHNERTTPSGEKVFFVEEIQSDLHQEGRKKGYGEQPVFAIYSGEGANRVLEGTRPTREDAEAVAKMIADVGKPASVEQVRSVKGVPDAPFKKTWHELVFKRMLRKAAEAGAEFLAWTTGEQQAKRYDLSKQISRIELQKSPGRENQQYLAAYDHDGRRVVDKLVAPDEVENYVGKEVAKKLEEMPWKPYDHENPDGSTVTQDSKVLRGLDLKVGGEGMKGFYDQMLPTFADKYLKRFGVRTESLDVSAGNARKGARMVDDGAGGLVPVGAGGKTETVHAVRLTPELKAEVLEKGQPLYMPQPPETGVDTTPQRGLGVGMKATLQDFEPDKVSELPKKTGWAIFSAENPNARRLSPEENAKRTAALWDELENLGYEAKPALGKYGNEENSFAVVGITPEEALELGRRYGQESVLTPLGLLYADGRTQALTGEVQVHATPPADFYTKVGDSYFTLGLADEAKPALAGETVSAEPKVLANARAGQKDRAVSTVPLRTGEETLDLGDSPTVLDVGRALAARARKLMRIPVDSRTDYATHAYATTLHDEIKHAASLSDNAIGWYKAKVSEALDTLGRLHPELKDNPVTGSLYKALLAITSNGQAVDFNFERAEELYSKYKKTGRIETDAQWGGSRQNQINGSLAVLQDLLDKFGPEKTVEFLNSRFSVRELKRKAVELGIEGDVAGGEGVDYVTYGAAIFGPKIGGGFYANLHGDFSPITVDMWLMRTWNRINGSYGVSDKALAAKAIDRIRQAAADNPDHPDSALVEGMSDRKLVNWAEKRYTAWVRQHFKDPDVFSRPTKNLTEALEGVEESPRGPSERQMIRDVFAEVDRMRAEEGLPSINNADKQALLWYYEKDLYSKLGVRTKTQEPTDYALAAKKVVEKRLAAQPVQQ